MIITIRDIRRKKHCSSGTRQFFKNHGLDWSDFLKNGIEDQALLDTKEQTAIEVVEGAWEAAKKSKR